ncbi:MAG: hypothetical protein JST55_02275 [Bacteroidetes bacterium]|nr:hypothetical protein [Bacteroidota bacterium]
MKKILSILIFTFLISGFSQAQYYKPNMQLIVKGVMNAPFYEPISENTSDNAFIGFQVEPVVNLSSHWGIFGTFNMGFIPSKDIARPQGTGSFKYSVSNEYSGYGGARYYFAPEDGRYIKVYVDAAAGVYSFNPSDAVFTSTTNPTYTKTFTFPGATQIGMNVGGGLNVNLSPGLFLNFGARFHNLFKKSDQTLTSTVVYNNGTPTEETTVIQDIPNRNYLQITAGLGFRFGL